MKGSDLKGISRNAVGGASGLEPSGEIVTTGHLVNLLAGRPGRQDIEKIKNLIFRTIDTNYGDVYPPRAIDFFKEFHSEENIQKRIDADSLFILEEAGQLVATASLEGSEISGVFVEPDRQGNGFGQYLMERLEAQAWQNGVREICLSVSLPSRIFYERLHYHLIEDRCFDLGDGQLLRFWKAKKSLSAPDALEAE